jgi:deazaflavin-dependent oxidoreductase (nitroreductase family)
MAYLKPGPQYGIANWFMKRFKVTPVLVVRGRKTAHAQEIPIHVLAQDDTRYLVSHRGETQWVKNLRAAGGFAELRTKAGVEAIAATEVPDDAKPEIIAGYRKKWDSQTKASWKQLPDPADHPIFEIRPTTV